MSRWFLILLVCGLLFSCGSQPIKPEIDHRQLLISALISQNRDQIISHKNDSKLKVKDDNVIKLYLLAINNEPYQLISSSELLINNFHNYNSAQQSMIKPMLLWAYAHPIYRQETAKQVRLLQRESLMVAPSHINFKACEVNIEGCANVLRGQIATIISPSELTDALLSMAQNDPCINLTNENLSGEFGNQCLASRKGTLKVNLISKPQYLYSQWQDMLNFVE